MRMKSPRFLSKETAYDTWFTTIINGTTSGKNNAAV